MFHRIKGFSTGVNEGVNVDRIFILANYPFKCKCNVPTMTF